MEQSPFPNEIIRSTSASILSSIEKLSLSPQSIDDKPDVKHTTAEQDDISYFNRLMEDIMTMNLVRANDPASFTHAYKLLLEEATHVWNRICASGVINSPEMLRAALAKSIPNEFSTPKRTPSDEGAGDTHKWGALTPSPQQQKQSSTPSSKKFFQWASLNGSKGASESPNWRADTTDSSKKSTPSMTSSPRKEPSLKELPRNLFASPSKTNEANMDNTALMHKLEKKIAVPESPGYNYIGRILGPRGISIRQLEAATQCGILIRGKGSVKDPEKEQVLSGKPGYEHLDEPLHVHITATGPSMAQCQEKMNQAISIVESLLTPTYDEYKKTQLIHLAIINGTYRSPTKSPEKKENASKVSATKSPKKQA